MSTPSANQQLMLTTDEFAEATKIWKKSKTNFTDIKKLVQPSAAFCFRQEDLEWFRRHNNNHYFHAYPGVHNDELVLIIVPVGLKGAEIPGPYLAVQLNLMKRALYLSETTVTTTVQEITLSANLQITKNEARTNLPYNNKPSINLADTIAYIQAWRNQCMNWFMVECNAPYNGERIVEYFKVPSGDLLNAGEHVVEAYCFFGFKESLVFKGLLPLLVFVGLDSKTQKGHLIKTSRQENHLRASSEESSTNADDWSTPCPPFCGSGL